MSRPLSTRRVLCAGAITVAAGLCLFAMPFVSLTRGQGRMPLSAHRVLDCAAPYFRPTVQLHGPLAPFIGTTQRDDVWLTVPSMDVHADFAWAEQFVSPSGRTGYAVIFTRDGATGAVHLYHVRRHDHGWVVTAVARSGHWLIYNGYQYNALGSPWEIVAVDLAHKTERLLTTSLVGLLDAGSFAITGDDVVYITASARTHAAPGPLLDGGVHNQLVGMNLRTGRHWVIADSKDGYFMVPQASGGHVVWEWTHHVRGGVRSEVDASSITGGAVMRVSGSGDGSEPTIDWPYVTYLTKKRFDARPSLLVVRDLRTGWQRSLAVDAGADRPEITGGLVMYELTISGQVGLFDYARGQHIAFAHDQDAGLNNLGSMAQNGWIVARLNEQGTAHGHGALFYRVTAIKVPWHDPLDAILTCQQPVWYRGTTTQPT